MRKNEINNNRAARERENDDCEKQRICYFKARCVIRDVGQKVATYGAAQTQRIHFVVHLFVLHRTRCVAGYQTRVTNKMTISRSDNSFVVDSETRSGVIYSNTCRIFSNY